MFLWYLTVFPLPPSEEGMLAAFMLASCRSAGRMGGQQHYIPESIVEGERQKSRKILSVHKMKHNISFRLY